MRRLLSILLLMVLGIGPNLASVPANAFSGGILAGIRAGLSDQPDESQLPACCRRNGKHHCALSARAAIDGQIRESSIGPNDSCPCAPQALESTAPAFAAILNSRASAPEFPSTLRSVAISRATVDSSDRRTQPQRGPPALQIA